MRFPAWLLIGVALGGTASLASAQASTERPRVAATLQYTRDDAAARCPSDVELREAVSRELGYPVFERAPATRAVLVHIEAIKGRGRDALRARVELRDASGASLGERAIDSAGGDCVELASALTLAIGLALDPSYAIAKGRAAQSAECPAPAPCPVCPPQQASDAERAAPPPSAEPEESSWRGFRLGAGLALGVGALPSPSGGGLIHAGATWERASVALEAVLHPGVRGGELAATPDATDPVEAELLRGQLAVCGRVPLASAWTFDACGLGALGALRGRGVGTGKHDASLAASAGARAGVTLALSELLFLQGRLDAQANLVRTTLNVEDAPAWTSPPLWGELSALIGARVW